jgi:biopolymer transport protein ExbD
MALKRQYQNLSNFSMSSMTDVIFLLLIFFMVTSTLVFPSAIDVNLPESGEQTSEKPVTEVYLTGNDELYLVTNRSDSVAANTTPRQVTRDELLNSLVQIHQVDSTRAVALYADTIVRYGKVVELLDMAAKANLKMVLATRASQTATSQIVNTPVAPAAGEPLK